MVIERLHALTPSIAETDHDHEDMRDLVRLVRPAEGVMREIDLNPHVRQGLPYVCNLLPLTN